MPRFTAWLSDRESAELEARAAAACTSKNMIVRAAVRAVLFNEAVPSWAKKQETTGVTK